MMPTGPFLELENFSTDKYLPEIKVPVLLLYGTHDAFCNVNNTLQLLNAIGSQNKELVVFGNAAHGLMLEELVHREVYHTIYAWIEHGKVPFELTGS